MKHIYIITETGRVWGKEGLEWIETVLKPALNETDELLACMGFLYNSPQLLLDELTGHPDSYVLLSYEHIDVIRDAEVREFCRLLRAGIESGEDVTSWQVLRRM